MQLDLQQKEAVFKAISNMLNDKYEISWKNAEIIKRPQWTTANKI